MIEPARSPRPLHATPVVRLAAVALLVLVVVGSWTGSAQGQTSEGESPAPAPRLTAVDATGGTVAVELVGLAATDPGPVQVVVEGETVAGATLATSTDAGRSAEVVVVVDAHVRGTLTGALEVVINTLGPALAATPEGTTVAVLAAADGAPVLVRATGDTAAPAAAFDNLSVRNRSSLYTALERGAEQFSSDPSTVKSLIVVSTGPNESDGGELDHAQVPLLQTGVQVLSVSFQGGEPALADLAERTAGLSYPVGAIDELAPALVDAVEKSTSRTVVSFPGPDLDEARLNSTLAVGERTFAFSYPAGLRTVNPLQLGPEATVDPSGFVLFDSPAGLYVALGLAFVGISLGVWSLGTMMTGRQEDLEGVLARYAEDRQDPEVETTELVVQSALLQRAVTLGETFAERQGFKARIEDLLEQANIPVRVGEAMFILTAAVILAASFGLVLTRSALGSLVFGLLALGLVFFVVRFRGRRRFRRFEAQLPDTLQLLSGTLRAGYSLPQGLDAVSNEIADPMGQELRRAMTETRLGRELEEALNGVAERMSSPDFAWTVMAIGIQREVGGNLNELLLSVSDTMIARDRLKREVSALTAEGKMSAGVLSFLPPGLGVIMWVINPGYVSVLFTETMGNILLGLGLLSGTVGLAWMKKVITVDV